MKSRQHRIYEVHLKALKKLLFAPEIRTQQDKVNHALGRGIKAIRTSNRKRKDRP